MRNIASLVDKQMEKKVSKNILKSGVVKTLNFTGDMLSTGSFERMSIFNNTTQNAMLGAMIGHAIDKRDGDDSTIDGTFKGAIVGALGGYGFGKLGGRNADKNFENSIKKAANSIGMEMSDQDAQLYRVTNLKTAGEFLKGLGYDGVNLTLNFRGQSAAYNWEKAMPIVPDEVINNLKKRFNIYNDYNFNFN